MATVWHKRTTVVSIFQIGTSKNVKCAIWNGFCKPSHTYGSQFGMTPYDCQLPLTDFLCSSSIMKAAMYITSLR